LLAYVPRKRFRSPKNARRAELAAERKRRERTYEAAVAAGHPLAVEAQFWKHPMNRYHAQAKSLAPADRAKLLEQCQALHDTPEARKKYLELREQVIAAVTSIFD
jgi:hypothetical protein